MQIVSVYPRRKKKPSLQHTYPPLLPRKLFYGNFFRPLCAWKTLRLDDGRFLLLAWSHGCGYLCNTVEGLPLVREWQEGNGMICLCISIFFFFPLLFQLCLEWWLLPTYRRKWVGLVQLWLTRYCEDLA